MITLGLSIDEYGFPKASKVMPGNQYEPNSLIGMIANLENKSVEELEKTIGLKKHKTVIMDAGLSTKANLEMLTKYGYDYICVARGKPISAKEIKKGKLIKIRETHNNNIKVQLFSNEDSNVLYCKSELKGNPSFD